MHTWSRFLPITEARGVLCPNTQRLCPLLTGHVAGLVWVPYLFAVVAELGLAAFSLAHQFGAAGTSVGNHSITIGRKEGQDSQPGNKRGRTESSLQQTTQYWAANAVLMQPPKICSIQQRDTVHQPNRLTDLL